jgi:hypothetical protein
VILKELPGFKKYLSKIFKTGKKPMELAILEFNWLKVGLINGNLRSILMQIKENN